MRKTVLLLLAYMICSSSTAAIDIFSVLDEMETILYPVPAKTCAAGMNVPEQDIDLFSLYKVNDGSDIAKKLERLQEEQPDYNSDKCHFQLELTIEDEPSDLLFQSLEPQGEFDEDDDDIFEFGVRGRLKCLYKGYNEGRIPIRLSSSFPQIFESGLISCGYSENRAAYFGFFGCLISFSESTVVLEIPELKNALNSLGPMRYGSLIKPWSKNQIYTWMAGAEGFPLIKLAAKPVHFIHIKRFLQAENYFNITFFTMTRYGHPVGLKIEWSTFAVQLSEEMYLQLKRDLAVSDGRNRRICLTEPDETIYLVMSPCAADDDCSNRLILGYDITFSDLFADNHSILLASVEPSIPLCQYHPDFGTEEFWPCRSVRPMSDLEQEALEQIPHIRNLTKPGQVEALLSRLEHSGSGHSLDNFCTAMSSSDSSVDNRSLSQESDQSISDP
ncbi:hypothetical protein ACWJJH_02635 [Endozoicomonadaceae bacterium StTr2]